MSANKLQRLKRWLRSPALITAEIAAITLAGVLGATFPQASTSGGADLERLHALAPGLVDVGQALGLHHIFQSAWFLCAVALATLSLVVVVVDQIRRLCLTWSHRPDVDAFRSAPYRVEFERPLPQAASDTEARVRTRTWTENRLGAAGGPVLHLGLLLVILAGAVRALFGSEAVVDLMEGETLPATASAWGVQKPGRFADPIRLAQPVALKHVEARRYPGGDLQGLSVGLDLAGPGGTGVEPEQVPVNGSVDVSGTRLYVGSDYGPAALIEWSDGGGAPARTAVLLKGGDIGGRFEASLGGPDGRQAHIRAEHGHRGERPALVEVRIMKAGALVFTGTLRPGETVALPGAGALTLHGLPFWARLHASRDPSLGCIYAGLALVVTGVSLLYMLIRVDACVVVTPEGARERVLVALRPHRLAPLFAERFERLVARERQGGGPAEGAESAAASPTACRSLAGVPHQALLIALVCLTTLTGCRGTSRSEARQLVERYNAAVSEAYRRGDVKLVDGIVGNDEGRKITGLIGVRLDSGITLDSKLLTLDVLDVTQEDASLTVRTRESWRYCERRIGSGQQMGAESEDHYEMFYHFSRTNRQWLVERIDFAKPPQMKRQGTPLVTDHGEMKATTGLHVPAHGKETGP